MYNSSEFRHCLIVALSTTSSWKVYSFHNMAHEIEESRVRTKLLAETHQFPSPLHVDAHSIGKQSEFYSKSEFDSYNSWSLTVTLVTVNLSH